MPPLFAYFQPPEQVSLTLPQFTAPHFQRLFSRAATASQMSRQRRRYADYENDDDISEFAPRAAPSAPPATSRHDDAPTAVTPQCFTTPTAADAQYAPRSRRYVRIATSRAICFATPQRFATPMQMSRAPIREAP
jgi:hypothetical protein